MSDAAINTEHKKMAKQRVIAWLRHLLRMDAVQHAERVNDLICNVRDGIRECRKQLRNDP